MCEVITLMVVSLSQVTTLIATSLLIRSLIWGIKNIGFKRRNRWKRDKWLKSEFQNIFVTNPFHPVFDSCWHLSKFKAELSSLWLSNCVASLCLQETSRSGFPWWSKWSPRVPGSAQPPGTTADRMKTPACLPTPGTTLEVSLWCRYHYRPKWGSTRSGYVL